MPRSQCRIRSHGAWSPHPIDMAADLVPTTPDASLAGSHLCTLRRFATGLPPSVKQFRPRCSYIQSLRNRDPFLLGRDVGYRAQFGDGPSMSQVQVTYDGDQHCTALSTKNGKTVAVDCPMTKGEAFSPGSLVAAGLAGCMLISMARLI